MVSKIDTLRIREQAGELDEEEREQTALLQGDLAR